MAWKKTEEEKAQKAEDKAARNFAATPVGQARIAYHNGDGWFELEMDVRHTGSDSPYGFTYMDMSTPNRLGEYGVKASRSDTLSLIEAEGWSLEHANYVYVQTGEQSRDKWMSSGQMTSVRGKIVGVYLFQRK